MTFLALEKLIKNNKNMLNWSRENNQAVFQNMLWQNHLLKFGDQGGGT